MKKIFKNKKFIVFLVVLLTLIIVCISIIVAKTNKTKIEKRNKEKVASKYLEAIIDYNYSSINSLVSPDNNGSYIAKEVDYLVDIPTAVNLVKAIASTVSYELVENDKVTCCELSFIDYKKLYNTIEQSKEDIIKGSNSIKTGTPRDKYILRDYSIEYITQTILKIKNRKKLTVKLEYVTDGKELLIKENTDLNIDEILYSDLDLVKTINYIAETLDIESVLHGEVLGVEKKIRKNIAFSLGSGTKENPACIGKDVETKYLRGKKSSDIYIRIDKVYTQNEAIELANAKHIDNRGITLNNSMKLIIVDFTITNLTNKSLNVESKLALSDNLGNLSTSTGKLFGLKEYGKLKPYDSVQLQWYSFNEDFSNKKLVWGSNFDRKYPFIWFNIGD